MQTEDLPVMKVGDSFGIKGSGGGENVDLLAVQVDVGDDGIVTIAEGKSCDKVDSYYTPRSFWHFYGLECCVRVNSWFGALAAFTSLNILLYERGHVRPPVVTFHLF